MDIVIITALIPVKKAPILIKKYMVDDMKLGSVVVDLASEVGGNIETIIPGECTVYNNVTHIGYTDLPSRLPTQASTLYSNNISKLLLSMAGDKDHYYLDMADDVVRGSIVLNNGKVTWPADPPIAVVAAAPPKKGAAVAAAEQKEPDYFGDKLKQAATYTAGLGTLNKLGMMMGIPAGAFLAAYGYAVSQGYPEVHQMAYLTSGLCCIGALGGLSAQPTARLGANLGTLGLLQPNPEVLAQMAGTAGIGAVLGTTIAKKIEITDLPQLVAAFHSLVGMAAMLTCVATYIDHYPYFATDPAAGMIKATTYIGSLIASGKLNGNLSFNPLMLPGRHALNVGAIGYFMVDLSMSVGLGMLGTTAALSGVMGVTLTMATGGADMPVVITVLNSYSGWALCAEGFMLQLNLFQTLVVTSLIVSNIEWRQFIRLLPGLELGEWLFLSSVGSTDDVNIPS